MVRTRQDSCAPADNGEDQVRQLVLVGPVAHERHTLEQFVKNCSLWEETLLEFLLEKWRTVCFEKHAALEQVKSGRTPPPAEAGVAEARWDELRAHEATGLKSLAVLSVPGLAPQGLGLEQDGPAPTGRAPLVTEHQLLPSAQEDEEEEEDEDKDEETKTKAKKMMKIEPDEDKDDEHED
ncbi:hypothetical protein TURU_069895 [Turdus rufiventris]|nr:hypothetical protein TURU_069895 [Turdus rufiventris]